MKSSDLKRFIKARRISLACLLLAALTLIVYWRVLGFEFTNYDEFQMVLQNPFVLSGLTRQGLSWAMTTSWFEYWHPLTWISHMLDCELFGLNAGWHHLVSLGFHIANTLLLFVVLQRLTGAFWRSAMVAALFALHPLHVESVAWVAERKDVLSAFFFMLTLWAYARYVELRSPNSEVPSQQPALGSHEPVSNNTQRAPLTSQPSSRFTFHVSRPPFHVSRYYLLSLFFFACGLMSKPMLVTVPFVLLLLDYWPLRRLEVQSPTSKVQCLNAECGMQNAESRFTFHVSRFTFLPLLVEKLPFLALSAASCAITYLGVKAGGSILSAEKVPWGLRLANVPVSYVRYLWKTIWPVDLIALYPMPSHWPGWQVGGAVLLLAAITLFVALRARSNPYLIVGWLVFLGMLFPTIGVVQVGFQSIADRYTYIPLIGIFIAAVWGVAEWAGNNHRWTQRDSDAFAKAEGTSQKAETEHPTSITHDRASRLTFHVSRFTFLICRSLPFAGAATLALLLCGWLTCVQLGHWRNSTALWTHCLAVCPDNLIARYNLGYVFQHSGRTSESIEQYRAALRLKPDHLDANLNLGIALMASGQTQEATNYLAVALRVKPDYARAQGAMGLALYQLGDYAGAVRHCAEAIRLDPNAFGPYVDMGQALSAQGKSDEALRYYAEGLRLNPALAQTHYYLGLEWIKRGEFEQAAASFGEAMRLAPGWTEAHAQQQRALDQVKKPEMDTNNPKQQ